MRGSESVYERNVRASSATAEDNFDEAVDDEADPCVDEDSEIQAERFVTGGGGQVWYENEKVEKAAEDDGGELLEEAGEHRVTFNFEIQQRPARVYVASGILRDGAPGEFW